MYEWYDKSTLDELSGADPADPPETQGACYLDQASVDTVRFSPGASAFLFNTLCADNTRTCLCPVPPPSEPPPPSPPPSPPPDTCIVSNHLSLDSIDPALTTGAAFLLRSKARLNNYVTAGPDADSVDAITAGSHVYALEGDPAGSTGNNWKNRLALTRDAGDVGNSWYLTHVASGLSVGMYGSGAAALNQPLEWYPHDVSDPEVRLLRFKHEQLGLDINHFKFELVENNTQCLRSDVNTNGRVVIAQCTGGRSRWYTDCYPPDVTFPPAAPPSPPHFRYTVYGQGCPLSQTWRPQCHDTLEDPNKVLNVRCVEEDLVTGQVVNCHSVCSSRKAPITPFDSGSAGNPFYTLQNAHAECGTSAPNPRPSTQP